MLITFGAILIGLFAINRPLQRNGFFIMNSIFMVGIAYYVESHYFRLPMFSQKSFMIFLIAQIVTINITTFFAYGIDKKRAKNKKYRISEETLHWLQILGGFVGAYIGQKFFKHKTKKASFIKKFWLIFILETVIVLYALKALI